MPPPVSPQEQISARAVMRVGKARVAELSKSEVQAWRLQKRGTLDEQCTRIILDDKGNVMQHRSHNLPPSLAAPAEQLRQQTAEARVGLEQAVLQSDALLIERYDAMKRDMREEVATLRSFLASSVQPAVPLPSAAGEVLPPTTSPLLGTFSPHLVSQHLPALFSFPVFHFGRDAFQPHLACCYTLNQAHQLIHRVEQQLASSQPLSLPTPSASPPASCLYAYHIGSGIGRLASHSDGPHPGAGERLLYQLQATRTTNAMLLVTCHTSQQAVSGGGLGREAEVAGEKVRCVVRVAKGLLREWQRCVKELQAEPSTSQQGREGEEQKESGWEPKDGPSAMESGRTEQPAVTFITQQPSEEAELDDEYWVEPEVDVDDCALPFASPLIPRLTHIARQNHYLHALASSLPALIPSATPRTTPTAVYWTLPSLRADVLSTLFPTVQPTSAAAFLASASLLAVRWQMVPCLEQEREWMLSEDVWEGVRDWLDKESAAERVREQWVEGSWSTVRHSMWDVYVRQMKFMHSAYRQADMVALAALDSPPLILRLLLLAVGAVLGWPQLQWAEATPYLTGLRAVPPQDLFAEFPPPCAPQPSEPASPPSSISASPLQHAVSKRIDASPYEHSHMVTNPLVSDMAAPGTAAGPLSRYSSYRSDLFAHLLSFDLCALSSATLQRVQSVLCEHALASSELPALDKHAPGSRWLTQWLVLVVRCNRLWQLSRQVFKVQVEEEEEAGDAGVRATSGERKSRRTVQVGDVEIEHDSGEEIEEEISARVPGSTAFTERGWTASRAASAL